VITVATRAPSERPAKPGRRTNSPTRAVGRPNKMRVLITVGYPLAHSQASVFTWVGTKALCKCDRISMMELGMGKATKTGGNQDK
jgi:hypothetical protein